MALANLAAYLLVLRLPIWLAAEEVLRWFTREGDVVTPGRKALVGIGLGSVPGRVRDARGWRWNGCALITARRHACALRRALREWHTFRIELERVADRASRTLGLVDGGGLVMSCWSRCSRIGLILVVIAGAPVAPAVRGDHDDTSHGRVSTVENDSGRATTINVAGFPVVARTNPFFLDLGSTDGGA